MKVFKICFWCDAERSGNQFPHVGTGHRFQGMTSIFWGKICLAQGHNTTTQVTLESGVRGVNHQATAPP